MHAAVSRPRRNPALALALCVACGTPRAQPAPDSSTVPDARAEPTTAAAAPSAGSGWRGRYELRGTLDRARAVAGAMALERLASGTPEYAGAAERVRRTYPSYAGPFYRARLSLADGTDTLRGTFNCAHGPATPPPLVCQPMSPLKGLENATLVVQPDGRAVLTGSHGEGVSVEYGRLTWTSESP